MTLTQLRYFQAVCRAQSVTRAAESLRVSQPSVSAAVRELEEEFGVTLFVRQHKGMALTEVGTLFLSMTDSLLSHADQVGKSMADIGQGHRQIHLGMPPMIGSLLLPGIYYGFLQEYPQIGIQLEEGGREDLLRQLTEGRLDMAFLPHDRPFDAAYETMHMGRLETVCCLSPVHPLVNRTELNIEDLAGEQLVLFKNSFFQTENIMRRFTAAGIEPQVLLYTDQLATVRRLVAMNLAVGFMFRSISEGFRDIISIPLAPAMPVDVSLVWRRGGQLFGDMRRFMEYLQSSRSQYLP